MENNVLNVKVSLFANVHSNEPIGEITLYDFLCGEKCREACLPLVERYRTADKNKEEFKKQIPAVTVSGTFKKRNAEEQKTYSGVICADIDAKDNTHIPNFEELSEVIHNIPQVAYFGRSVSGTGYFAIIPISDPLHHKQHFEALKADFDRCGITVDGNCGDKTRLRIYSYDPDAYINLDAKVYDRKIDTPKTMTKSVLKSENIEPATAIKVAMVIAEIVETKTDITDEYKHWVEIASAFYNSFGEAGRVLFHIVSRNSSKYSEAQTNKQFNDVIDKPYPYSIGTLFKYAKDAGINIR